MADESARTSNISLPHDPSYAADRISGVLESHLQRSAHDDAVGQILRQHVEAFQSVRKATSRLDEFNAQSGRLLPNFQAKFQRHVKLLRNLKADLENVYLRTRELKAKLEVAYPDKCLEVSLRMAQMEEAAEQMRNDEGMEVEGKRKASEEDVEGETREDEAEARLHSEPKIVQEEGEEEEKKGTEASQSGSDSHTLKSEEGRPQVATSSTLDECEKEKEEEEEEEVEEETKVPSVSEERDPEEKGSMLSE